MCKEKANCKACNCSTKMNISNDIMRGAVTGGTYFAAGKFVPQLKQQGEEGMKSPLMKQALLVGGVQLVQSSVEDVVKSVAPSVVNAINKSDYATPLEIGLLYAAGTSYLIKIDNRPFFLKFVHATGASVAGTYLGKMMMPPSPASAPTSSTA